MNVHSQATLLALLNEHDAQLWFATGALTTRFLPELIGSVFTREA